MGVVWQCVCEIQYTHKINVFKPKPSLMLVHKYAPEFPEDYRFWEGEWIADWLYQKDGRFNTISKTIHKVFPVLGGKVLVETAEETGEVDNAQIVSGYSMRYFNRIAEKWVMIQSWPSKGRNFMGTLTGVFDHRRCEMENMYTLEDVEYQQKYTFSDISNDYFRWDRQVSTDEGKSWELTMKVHFNKQSDIRDIAEEYDLFSYYNGTLNGNTELLFEKGVYDGQIKKDGDNLPTIFTLYDAIGGFGQLVHGKSTNDTEDLYFVNYDTVNSRWNLVHIDDGVSPHTAYYFDDTVGRFVNNEKFNEQSLGSLEDHQISYEFMNGSILFHHE